MVLLVACTQLVGWSSCWAVPVLPVDRLFARVTHEPAVLLQRSTTLAWPGSYAVLMECLIQGFSGLDCVLLWEFAPKHLQQLSRAKRAWRVKRIKVGIC